MAIVNLDFDYDSCDSSCLCFVDSVWRMIRKKEKRKEKIQISEIEIKFKEGNRAGKFSGILCAQLCGAKNIKKFRC